VPSKNQVVDTTAYDVVVVGAGLSGLSSAVYLTDAGKKVLLLEKEADLGGLASWSTEGPQVTFDRGAAYWTDTYEEEKAILDRIGLKDFKKQNPIPEPIDSYYVRGEFYSGIWDNETLKKLPASFELFRLQLKQADKDNLIPNQPFEEFEKYGGKMDLDRMTAKQWIESMPAALEKSSKNATGEAKRIWLRFVAERKAGKLAGSTGMQDVVELMDLYCRSALGNDSQFVSAMAFANFYISEIDTRYTSNQGTGIAAGNMAKILLSRPSLATIATKAPVAQIVSFDETAYVKDGTTHLAHSKYVVFAAQLKIAPKVIKGFATDSPAQVSLINSLGYSHYSVHVLYVAGHPYRATYDTWLRPADYTDEDPTDMILGRWMDPKILGYEGYRDFTKNPDDDKGIFTIYHPLSQKWLADGAYSDEKAAEVARSAASRLDDLLSKLPPSLFRGPLDIKKIETNRWPLSVHIAAPGHYIERVRTLRKPYRRIFFASNNLGTPAFEEALFRGHCAADNVLKRMSSKFQIEKWSRCPIDLN
jgi:hypothetical protein